METVHPQNTVSPVSQPPNPWGNCTTVTNIDGFLLYNWSVIPACLWAVAIGFIGARYIRNLTPGVRGSWSYKVTFLMYGVMMWHSMLVHTVTTSINNPTFTLLVAIIDLGLTSSIAVSFFWNGLVDLRLIDDRSPCSHAPMFLSYVLMIGAWTYALVHKINNAFNYLYLGVILVACGSYLVFQVITMFRNKKFSRFFLSAGIFGAAGIWSMKNNAVLCARLGPALNGSFWWDIFSDLAMIAILYFYFDTRVPVEEDPAPQSCCSRGQCERNYTPVASTNEHELQEVRTDAELQAQPQPQQFYVMPGAFPGQSPMVYYVQ
eukprot:TRINITY_DN11606_c1_g1_i1.p1 TRINITY_DN11606_c1_g1~~TRINITY_DN11606_c1_g1_i1.p1  ORF type:complete len:326 (+),score=66.74 TRINITY_DN11606_c1_g1_i1:23-979(+)